MPVRCITSRATCAHSTSVSDRSPGATRSGQCHTIRSVTDAGRSTVASSMLAVIGRKSRTACAPSPTSTSGLINDRAALGQRGPVTVAFAAQEAAGTGRGLSATARTTRASTLLPAARVV